MSLHRRHSRAPARTRPANARLVGKDMQVDQKRMDELVKTYASHRERLLALGLNEAEKAALAKADAADALAAPLMKQAQRLAPAVGAFRLEAAWSDDQPSRGVSLWSFKATPVAPRRRAALSSQLILRAASA